MKLIIRQICCFCFRRHRNRQNQDSCITQNRSCPAEESAQRRNYYLDLAGIENYEMSKDGTLLTSAQPCFGVFGDEELKRPQRKLKSKSSPSTTKRSRCIPGQTDFRCASAICEEDELTSANVVETGGDLTRMEVHTSLFGTSTPPLTPPAVNDVDTISSSHYRRRHRHRERNQSRAMKQVAEWIEKEHVYHETEKHVIVVQRHEHHHVHEHFHHHIHHSADT